MIRFLFLMLIASHAYAFDIINMTDEEKEEAYNALEWQEPGTYHLSQSHSVLNLKDDYYILLGDEAKKERLLMGDQPDDGIEATVYCHQSRSIVVFTSILDGYVKLNDWGDINAKELLENIKENTEAANTYRTERGLHPIHVVGWVKEPTLDKETNHVSWIIELEREDDLKTTFVNSLVLKLSRHGYESLIWVADMPDFLNAHNEIDQLLASHRFEMGHRYEDYVDGDKIAEYGIAALVTATVGAKILKSSGLLILLKKLLTPICAGIVAFCLKMKKKFFKAAC